MGKIIWVTGSDTGVGKTVLTALLLSYLRRSGVDALAMKPFACGGREDAELFDSIQNGGLPAELLNPFFFARPLAPLVAARLERRSVSVKEATRVIEAASGRCDVLLVEGCGGLLTPLGPRLDLLRLVAHLHGQTIVAAADRLGVLNQVRLVENALASIGKRPLSVALTALGKSDSSRQFNRQNLRQLIANVPIVGIPAFSEDEIIAEGFEKASKKIQKALAVLIGSGNYVPTSTIRRSKPPGKQLESVTVDH